jgi:porphobilinogen synthase
MLKRLRRNRKNPAIRALVEETRILASDLIFPFFLVSGKDQKQPISNLPGIDRLSLDQILKTAERLHRKGIQAVALFPYIPLEQKDATGKNALDPNGIVPIAIQTIKKEIPSLCVISDVALDPFSSHGHDGLVSPDGRILNDETVEILAEMALLHAQSGADIIAPSDMMDGRVEAIRKRLDFHDFCDVSILSYSAKYASSLYAPFRDALGSQLKFGDKKTYQLNPANVREALLETSLDEAEGADILMVKPALYYLDVLAKLRASTRLPLAAYHVSGEYAMVMAAHEKGFLDATQVFFESLVCIKRAGADMIFTYAVPHVIDLL